MTDRPADERSFCAVCGKPLAASTIEAGYPTCVDHRDRAPRGAPFPDPSAASSASSADETAEMTAPSASSSATSLDRSDKEAPYLARESAAFAGLAGTVVRLLAAQTEADPAGLLVNLLSRFGAMVGPTARVQVGAVPHPPALYVATVGRSSRSRKGTATAEIEWIFDRVEDDWAFEHRVSGFGSGEAFIEHAAAHPGDAIYMIESEFARLLAVASREGSSVSAVLRNAYDFRRLEHRVRKTVNSAPPAPVSLVGHVTIDELRDPRFGLRPVEVVNGFGNRILWIYVDRRRLVPRPERLAGDTANQVVRDLRDVVVQARRGPAVLAFSDAADRLWGDLYPRLSDDDAVGVLGAITARAEGQLVRLALIYALLDGSDVIDVPHIESAWEVWRYARWSAQFIFVGAGTGDADLDRIAAVLDGGDDLDMRDLDRMFFGHRSTAELRRRAVEFGIAREVRESTRGRDRILLRFRDKAEEAAMSGRWWIVPTYECSDDEGGDGWT